MKQKSIDAWLTSRQTCAQTSEYFYCDIPGMIVSHPFLFPIRLKIDVQKGNSVDIHLDIDRRHVPHFTLPYSIMDSGFTMTEYQASSPTHVTRNGTSVSATRTQKWRHNAWTLYYQPTVTLIQESSSYELSGSAVRKPMQISHQW